MKNISEVLEFSKENKDFKYAFLEVTNSFIKKEYPQFADEWAADKKQLLGNFMKNIKNSKEIVVDVANTVYKKSFLFDDRENINEQFYKDLIDDTTDEVFKRNTRKVKVEAKAEKKVEKKVNPFLERSKSLEEELKKSRYQETMNEIRQASKDATDAHKMGTTLVMQHNPINSQSQKGETHYAVVASKRAKRKVRM